MDETYYCLPASRERKRGRKQGAGLWANKCTYRRSALCCFKLCSSAPALWAMLLSAAQGAAAGVGNSLYVCVCVCVSVSATVCVFAPYRCVYLLPSICVWKRVNCVQDFALSAIRLSCPRQHAPPTLSTCPPELTSPPPPLPCLGTAPLVGIN